MPSQDKDSLGYAPYVSIGKRFRPARNTQVTVMFVEIKKDAPINAHISFEARPRAFNSIGMMTRSQLATSAKTPSRGLPTTERPSVASPIMFYHGDSPYMTAIIVNVTSTS